MWSRGSHAFVLLVVALALLGCAGGDDAAPGEDATTTSVTTSASSSPSPTAGGSTTTAAGSDGGGGADGGEGAPAVEDVADALADAGAGCEDVTAIDGVVDPTVAAAGECVAADTPAALYTFPDDAARDAFVDHNGVIPCGLIGPGAEFTYVVADGVAIRVDDAAAAEPIAAALGGEVRTATCGPDPAEG